MESRNEAIPAAINNVSLKNNESNFEKNYASLRLYSSGAEYLILENGDIYFVKGSYLEFLNDYSTLSEIVKEVNTLLIENDIKLDFLSKVSEEPKIFTWNEKEKELRDTNYNKQKAEEEKNYITAFIKEIFPDTKKDLDAVKEGITKANNQITLEQAYNNGFLVGEISGIFQIAKEDWRLSELFAKEEYLHRDSFKEYYALNLSSGGKKFVDSIGGYSLYEEKIQSEKQTKNKKEIAIKDGIPFSAKQYMDKVEKNIKIFEGFVSLSQEMQYMDENNPQHLETLLTKLRKISKETTDAYEEMASLKVSQSIQKDHKEVVKFFKVMNDLVNILLEGRELSKDENDPLKKVLTKKTDKKMDLLNQEMQNLQNNFQSALLNVARQIK